MQKGNDNQFEGKGEFEIGKECNRDLHQKGEERHEIKDIKGRGKGERILRRRRVPIQRNVWMFCIGT